MFATGINWMMDVRIRKHLVRAKDAVKKKVVGTQIDRNKTIPEVSNIINV